MIEVIDIKTLIENALKKSIKLKEVFIKNNSHYLSMRENMIIEKCNKLIQEDYIKNIRIKVGPVQVEKMKYCGGKNE